MKFERGEEYVWSPDESAARDELRAGRATRMCELLRDPTHELSQPLRDALAAVLEKVKALPKPRHVKAARVTSERAGEVLSLWAKEFPQLLASKEGDKAAADAEFARRFPEEHQLIPAAKEKLKPSEQSRLLRALSSAMYVGDGKAQRDAQDQAEREWQRLTKRK